MVVEERRYRTTKLLQLRYEVGQALLNMIAWVERAGGESIKRVHTYDANEFLALSQMFKERCILH